MTTRVTQTELQAVFLRFTRTLASKGVDVEGYALSRWAPGDGSARYRIERDYGATSPMGERYRTIADLHSALHFACNALDLIDTAQREMGTTS